jgi:SHS2 domain-containing protein
VPEYELIDHTADIGFRLSCTRLDDLFCQAAQALFDLTCNLKEVQTTEVVAVRVQAPDLESLLVAWLNELIFLHETQHMLFGRFELEIAGEFELSGKAYGESVDYRRHELYRSIKAATYHQLKVQPVGNSWIAQVVLDV